MRKFLITIFEKTKIIVMDRIIMAAIKIMSSDKNLFSVFAKKEK
jgi:hypothetical protein